jgi:hypothetical protein
MYTTNNEVINEELESLLESKYNDDYMEEPVDIEISENTAYLDVFTTYKDMFVNYYTNFVSLFSQHTSYGLNANYLPNFVSEVLTDKIKHNLLENTSEYSTNERPSVLVDFLLYHLNVSEQKLMRLNDTITAAEVSRIRTSHAIQDTLILCKDALTGKPYESPVGYRNSPIPVRNSLLFERGISLNSTPETVQTQFSDYQSSFVYNQPLINEINALMKSPYLDTSSPIIDTYSPSINSNSPSIDTDRSYSRSSTSIYKGIDFLAERRSSFKSGKESVGITTPVMDNYPTFRSSPLRTYEGLMIDGQTNTVEHRTTINKAPLRDVYSPNTLKRFGHV